MIILVILSQKHLEICKQNSKGQDRSSLLTAVALFQIFQVLFQNIIKYGHSHQYDCVGDFKLTSVDYTMLVQLQLKMIMTWSALLFVHGLSLAGLQLNIKCSNEQSTIHIFKVPQDNQFQSIQEPNNSRISDCPLSEIALFRCNQPKCVN